MRQFLAALGQAVLDALEHIGGVMLLALASLKRLFRPPLELNLIGRELVEIGCRSAGVVGLLGLFIGMVLVVQTGFTLKRFGAEAYVSEMVGLSIFRELGPVLTGFLVAGRVGSAIAAEIGSMAIGEQIDAMRSLGADPLRKLVIPKAVAGVLALPLLTVMVDVIGVVGGMVMGAAMLNIAPLHFINRIEYALTIGDFMSGVGKTAFFGGIIALSACYFGLRTTGGTVGVGRSATKSVVLSCIMILMADLLLTSVFVAVGGVMRA